MPKRRRKALTTLTQENLQKDLPLEKSNKPIVKVSVAGIGGVGKTTLCQRAMGRILDDYFSNYKVTIGVQFFTHNVNTDNGEVVLSVWDLAGQDQFQQIVNRFLIGSSGVILAYDSTDINSYFSLHHTWIPLIEEFCVPNVPILLVSTKNDLEEKKEVDPELVRNFISSKEEHNQNIIGFLETSSKSNVNVLETFEVLVKNIVKKEVEEHFKKVSKKKLKKTVN
ncbi:MAG: Rab family GTPase [Candidatus Heimdallarchaeota archaeon]